MERIGNFLLFVVPGEAGGIRTMVRINAVQIVSEVDCVGDEVLLTAAGGRTFHVHATLDQMRDLLTRSVD